MKSIEVAAYVVEKDVYHGKKIDFSVHTRITSNHKNTVNWGTGILVVHEENGLGFIDIMSPDQKNSGHVRILRLNESQVQSIKANRRGGFSLVL